MMVFKHIPCSIECTQTCKIEHIHLWTSNDVWKVKGVALFMVYVSCFQTSFCFGQSGKHKIWIHTLYHRIIALWRFQPQTAYLYHRLIALCRFQPQTAYLYHRLIALCRFQPQTAYFNSDNLYWKPLKRWHLDVFMAVTCTTLEYCFLHHHHQPLASSPASFLCAGGKSLGTRLISHALRLSLCKYLVKFIS